jgi:hypothetical protein
VGSESKGLEAYFLAHYPSLYFIHVDSKFQMHICPSAWTRDPTSRFLLQFCKIRFVLEPGVLEEASSEQIIQIIEGITSG